MTAPRPCIDIITGIIFDLDGTLIDSAPDIAASVNRYFASRGWPQLDVEFVTQYIGNGPQRLLADILAALDLPRDTATLAEAVTAYLAAYQAEPLRHTRLYPQVQADLRALRAEGFVLGICTNKVQAATDLVLRTLQLDDIFSVALGSDSVPACKPDPAHLLAAAERMGLAAGTWVYVGDSHVDQATAAAARVPFYAVPWGTGAALPVTAEQRLQRLGDLRARLRAV